MAGDQTNQSQGLTSRREALRKGVVIGGMALWVTPLVQTIGMTGAFAQTTSGAGGSSGGSTGGSTGGTTGGGTTAGGTTPNASTGSSPSEPHFDPNAGEVESSSQTASAPSSGGSQGTLARTGVDAEHVGEVGLAATALGVALTAISRIKESPSEDPNFDAEGYE
jgi:hypothetical protein